MPNVVPRGTLGWEWKRIGRARTPRAAFVPRGTGELTVQVCFWGHYPKGTPWQKKENKSRRKVVFHLWAVFAVRMSWPAISIQSSFPTNVYFNSWTLRFERFPQLRPVSHNASPCAGRDFPVTLGVHGKDRRNRQPEGRRRQNHHGDQSGCMPGSRGPEDTPD